MPDLLPMPDYTDPDDPGRLRANTSDRGWSPDRDDPDPAKLRMLYMRMDHLVGQGPDLPHGWDEGQYVSLLVDIAEVWTSIRTIQRGGE